MAKGRDREDSAGFMVALAVERIAKLRTPLATAGIRSRKETCAESSRIPIEYNLADMQLHRETRNAYSDKVNY